MVNRRQQKRRQSRSSKGSNYRTSKFKYIFRIFLLLCVCILIFIGIGVLKYGNIKKTNEQPKSFPVTVQN